MKIALILAPNFPRNFPLLGLASLNALLRHAGHQALVFDFSATRDYPHCNGETHWNEPSYVHAFASSHPDFFEGICDELAAFAPDIAAFSVWQSNAPASQLICAALKNRLPSAFTVFGGPEAGFRAGELLSTQGLDALVCGEGENAMLDLAESVRGGRLPSPPPGVLLNDGGVVRSGGPVREVLDLDSLPLPDFSGFELERYSTRLLPVSLNRGCANRCAFCNTPDSWPQLRLRSADSVFKEMLRDNELYGAEIFQVCSPAMNPDPHRLARLCELIIGGGRKFVWNGSAFFSEGLTPELCSLMGRAGVQVIDFGLESASPRVLSLMGKRFSPETASRNMRDCHAAGIRVFINVIVGFPGEQPRDLELTKRFLLENKTFISRLGPPSECVSARGSLLYNHPESYGLNPDRRKQLSSWESQDGSSTHALRQAALAEFKTWAVEHGLAFAS